MAQAAYAGDSSAAQKYILEYDLDVNTPRRRPQQSSCDLLKFDSLLHVAASRCDETLVMILIERGNLVFHLQSPAVNGAKHTVLNKNQLTPFHAAIKAGKAKVIKFKFIIKHGGKSFEGYHPSKTAP